MGKQFGPLKALFPVRARAVFPMGERIVLTSMKPMGLLIVSHSEFLRFCTIRTVRVFSAAHKWHKKADIVLSMPKTP
jgi:hypothetical protein